MQRIILVIQNAIILLPIYYFQLVATYTKIPKYHNIVTILLLSISYCLYRFNIILLPIYYYQIIITNLLLPIYYYQFIITIILFSIS
jgi:hypothetical protein